MPRAIWTGAISFGLVNVPVKLYSATEQKDISFHQFQEGTGERIRYKRVAEESGEEVDYADIVKGYEVDKGRFVMVDPDELEAIEPEKTRAITIDDFVDLVDIDPIYYDKTYYLAPAEDVGAERPYALLREAMEETQKVGIGRFVMRTKEYLVAVRPSGDILNLETLFFADEVRDPKAIETIPVSADVSEREREIATRLIDSLTTNWQPEQYRDTYRDKVLDLVERKAAGEEIVEHRPEEEPKKVVDLMAALEASVAEARQRRSGNGNGNGKASGDGRSKGGNRYDDMTAEELYEEAKKKDVPGRSKMDKDELIDALRQAS